MFADLRFRWRALFRRNAVERELAAELAHHAASQGPFPESDAVAEACRDARGVTPLQDFGRDLRWAWRSLRHSSGFAVPAVLTLALGMGAAIAIFSVADAVLLQPLSYPGAAQLVVVRERIRLVASNPIQVSAPDIAFMRQGGPSFAGLAAYTSSQYNLTGAGAPRRIPVTRISSALLPLLHATPARGRNFTPAEDPPGHSVVLLSDSLWRSSFGADPGVVGRTVDLEGEPYTVIGVMPRGFEFPPRGLREAEPPAAAWVPLAISAKDLADLVDNFDYGVIARLRPGATLAQARAQMTTAAARIQQNWRAKVGDLPGLKLEVVVDPLRDLVISGARQLLNLLLVAAALLLLLSVANAANLFLVRASARRREWSLRAALGAGRWRLARQALAEPVLVALLAAALGVGFAWMCLRGLVAAAPSTLPQVQRVAMDPFVLGVALLLALSVGPLCGLLVFQASDQADLERDLRAGTRSLAGARRDARWRSCLVIAQVALAFTLACGAGLLLRSLYSAENAGAGVTTAGRVTASLALPAAAYGQPSHIASWGQALVTSLTRQPGSQGAALATDLPTASNWDHIFSIQGQPTPLHVKLPHTAQALVIGPYFSTLGIPLLQGRGFTPLEDQGQSHVVIVSANLARRFWPGHSAIGQRLKWGPAQSSDPWLTIVGVAGDIKADGLDSPVGFYTFSPYRQECTDASPHELCRSLQLTLRSGLSEPAAAGQIRVAVAAADPTVPVADVRSLEAAILTSITPRRFNTVLFAFFGIAALLLAAIGLYGVLAFVVASERRAIGVRMALGARPARILEATLARGARWALFGLALGAAAAALLSQWVRSLLYATPALDPLTWLTVAALVLGVALAASLWPALRASRISPQEVLRES